MHPLKKIAVTLCFSTVVISCTSHSPTSGLEPELPVPGETFAEECSQCHGDAQSPAPPRGLNGVMLASDMGVGAHRSHLFSTESSTWHQPIPCASCHVVPAEITAPGHMDDGDNQAEVLFAGVATTGGVTPSINAEGQCSNVYCHGATLSGGTNTTPSWNLVAPSQDQCGSCHGAPPPAPHPADPTCGNCHVNMDGNNAFLDPNLHINGIVELANQASGSCTSCHGSDGMSAPPKDLAGATDRAEPGVGAHREHLAQSPWRRDINCSNCHVVPGAVEAPGHIDGDNQAEIPFDALNPIGTYNFAPVTCSNLYCHGDGQGNNGSIRWTDITPMTCDSCHQTPAPGERARGMSGAHDEHIRDEDIPCVECHAGVVDLTPTIIDAQLHINGQRNILMPQGGTWDPLQRRCSNLACHEDESWDDD